MRLRDNYFKERKFECVETYGKHIEREKNLLRKEKLINRSLDEAEKDGLQSMLHRKRNVASDVKWKQEKRMETDANIFVGGDLKKLQEFPFNRFCFPHKVKKT